MPEHYLSVIVYGAGDDPNNRSHWAFAFHRPGSDLCNLLHVLLIDLSRLIYQFETRHGIPLQCDNPEGYFTLACLDTAQYTHAIRIISGEPAPRNGVDRGQDWVLSCVISLEAEEIVAAGSSEWVESLVGLPATTLASRAGQKWHKAFREDW